MWFNKISIQFAQPHSKSCFLHPSLFLLASVCSSYFNLNLSVSRSPILCCCLSCPLETVCHRFPSLFPASAYKPKTLPPPSQVAGNGEKVAKAWLRCQFINTTPWETAWMKAPMALENYPPSRGQVICYTVEHHNKHSNTSADTQSNEVQTGSTKIWRSEVPQKKKRRNVEVEKCLRTWDVSMCKCVNVSLHPSTCVKASLAVMQQGRTVTSHTDGERLTRTEKDSEGRE